MKHAWTAGRRLLPVGAAALLAFSALPKEGADPLIPDAGLVERVGVRLMLIDVEVRDESGRPLRGLKLADFSVRLDGRPWVLQTVDDLCTGPLVDGAPPDRRLEEPLLEPADPGERAESVVTASAEPPPWFIIYLDFSQLMADGRVNATKAAKRWVSEVMTDEDRTMLVVYASQSGLKVLSGFTGDRLRLSSLIDEAYGNVAFIDTFPSLLPIRVSNCELCCLPNQPCNCAFCWRQAARDEWFQGRRSLQAVQQLLQRLDRTPGRKALLLFHQNTMLQPARYYHVSDERGGGDHLALADEVAGEAALSRTAIYPAYSGEGDNPWAVNFGANLADLSGGAYNRSAAELDGFVRGAERGNRCLYRLGLSPAEKSGSHVHRLKVAVRGRNLPGVRPVLALGASERWMREARAVLADPDGAHDIPVAVAIVPVAGRDDGWDLRVEVVLSPSAIGTIPGGAGRSGSWEVGALLLAEDAEKSWDMLGVTELRRGGAGATATAVLHERVFEGLQPGKYEFRAFVRDKLANLYGAALAEIELPRTSRAGIVGPLLMRADASYLHSWLPFRKRDAGAEAQRESTITSGPVPLGGRPVLRGEPIELSTWVCPGKHKDSVFEIVRFVSRDDEPVFRFDAPNLTKVGNCMTFRDRIETAPLPAGRYVYHVRWNTDPEIETTGEASFEIAEPAGAPPAGGS